MADARPLLFFDSGVGGLSVLAASRKLLPQAPIVYAADSAGYPYGTKTEAEIAALSPLRLPVVDKPMTLAYGSRELPALVHDARRFHALRAAAHAPGALLPVPGVDHFSILDGFTGADGLFVRAARDLLDTARARGRAEP